MAGLIDFLFPTKKPRKHKLPRVDMEGKPLPPEELGAGLAKDAADKLKNRKRRLDDALRDAGA